MLILRSLMAAALLISTVGCGGEPAPRTADDMKKENEAVKEAAERKLPMTEEQWKKVLTPEQFRVAREKGTERAFTGKYYNLHANGSFHCVCCGDELFTSDTKFESGTGWPSFYAPANDKNVKVNSDTSHGMVRDEVTCKRCGAHLGHVFDDGPRPTGKRYCINSVSLVFNEKKEAEAKK